MDIKKKKSKKEGKGKNKDKEKEKEKKKKKKKKKISLTWELEEEAGEVDDNEGGVEPIKGAEGEGEDEAAEEGEEIELLEEDEVVDFYIFFLRGGEGGGEKRERKRKRRGRERVRVRVCLHGLTFFFFCYSLFIIIEDSIYSLYSF